MNHAAEIRARAYAKLRLVYGEPQASALIERIDRLIAEMTPRPGDFSLSERDALIIAYGDHLHRAGEAPLATLRTTLKRLALPLSGLHILPFFPYSSDDGFSVIDYRQVDPALGSWDDVRALCADFRVMFDAVFNHISAQSGWFQAFLRGEAPYTDYFITVDPSADLSQVTRPRALPLLTPFETPTGRVDVWTTFSDDQIDLNYANPDVLIAMIAVLLFYVEQGANLIRLDAIAFLWKQIGTSCLHLPQTHLIIQLLRDVLDLVAPGVILITETNVPQRENLSYFGDGTDEAQLVYQFPLPPLILHTLRTGDARRLTELGADCRARRRADDLLQLHGVARRHRLASRGRHPQRRRDRRAGRDDAGARRLRLAEEQPRRHSKPLRTQRHLLRRHHRSRSDRARSPNRR